MNFILPNQLSGFQCNTILINEFNQFNINAVKGIVPFHILNGEINENKNKQFYTINSLQESILSYNNFNVNTFYFYWNNALIQNNDLDDIFTENLIKLFLKQPTCDIYLIVSSPILIEWLDNNYPQLKCIFSINTETDLLIFNQIQKHSNIKGVEINLRLNIDKSLFNSFKIIGKIPLFNCDTCLLYNSCYQKEQLNILEFSEISNIADCQIKNWYSLTEILNIYENAINITDTFSFSEIPVGYDEGAYRLIEQFYFTLRENSI